MLQQRAGTRLWFGGTPRRFFVESRRKLNPLSCKRLARIDTRACVNPPVKCDPDYSLYHSSLELAVSGSVCVDERASHKLCAAPLDLLLCQSPRTMLRMSSAEPLDADFYNCFESLLCRFDLALDQKRGQATEPKLIKPTWEKDFDQLRDSDRSARLPDYRD